MDSQRNDFKKLVESQFAFLESEEIADASVLANAFEILQPQREKLNDFADSVFQLLVAPRARIVAAQFGKRAKYQKFGNDAVLLIEPSTDTPGEAKFRLTCDLFLPEESLTFSCEYRITTGKANYSAEDWTRFTIPTFNQSQFCNWLEKAFIQFIDSYTTSAQRAIDENQN